MLSIPEVEGPDCESLLATLGADGDDIFTCFMSSIILKKIRVEDFSPFLNLKRKLIDKGQLKGTNVLTLQIRVIKNSGPIGKAFPRAPPF